LDPRGRRPFRRPRLPRTLRAVDPGPDGRHLRPVEAPRTRRPRRVPRGDRHALRDVPRRPRPRRSLRPRRAQPLERPEGVHRDREHAELDGRRSPRVAGVPRARGACARARGHGVSDRRSQVRAERALRPSPYRLAIADDAAALEPDNKASGAPEQGEQAPPGQRSRRRRVLRIAGWVAAALIVLAAGAFGYVYWKARSLIDELHAGPKGRIVAMTRNELATPPPRSIDEMLADAESPTPTRQPAPPKADSPARSVIALPLAQPLVRVEKPSKQTVPDPEDLKAQTILLIGSDRRWGLPGARSDTIILVRLNPANHTVGLLSVPRDLKVPIPGYGVDRINAAFEHGGEALLVKTLRDYLGVRIDHFIEVNFRGFQQVVNTLGGVLIPVDGRYYNHNDGSAAHNFADIDLQPGYQRLNATQALAYARFRHYDSDVYRAARQQLFLREVMREVFASKYQFLKLERILEVFAKATASDISSLHTIWTLTTTLHSTPTDHVTRAVVPGADSVEYGAYYYESSAPERQAALLR